MPRFIENGPDIPEGLLWEHEEGRVVFFCGAGISYPADLPDFKGLVKKIYAKLGTDLFPIEAQAFNRNQYDATLDLLEHRFPGNRLAVRTALASILSPRWRKKDSTTTHRALVQLSTDRNGKVRLVTTNFDRIFHRLITRYWPDVPLFSAPLLPIPKPSRWHGVVHLHGLLPCPINEIELNRLVLSSGDFGLAYLTERWAARFLSELFRYYTVCFVGYSINDPVLRYMMDALAVDEMLGETRPLAYAFGSYENGCEQEVMLEWEAKGVKPLLYRASSNGHDHSLLHRTLKQWADTYRDGVRGKEMIVAQHATTPPLTSSRLDYAVGRVLWALTDGLAAKHFADLSPSPPLEWLKPFAENQFKHEDLERFGVSTGREKESKLLFSLIHRPSSYALAPRMSLVHFRDQQVQWDEVMFHLGRWLSRHLDDPKLVLWLAKEGGHLDGNLASLLQQRFREIDRLVAANSIEELDRIRSTSPKAIPRPLMRVLWRLLFAGLIKSRKNSFDLYDWFRRLNRDGLTPTMRLELRQNLSPRVSLQETFSWGSESEDTGNIRDLMDFEIVLATDDVHSVLAEVKKSGKITSALPHLLMDFSMLLLDVLDLMRELGSAQDKSDLSYIQHPSISAHSQNRNFRDWTALVDLTRDAWVAMMGICPEQAVITAQWWWQKPYPLFKRLTFFAGTYTDVIPSHQGLGWLLSEGNWWLWSVETQREALSLIAAVSPHLGQEDVRRLEHAILQGPPREMFKDHIDTEQFKLLRDRGVWVRLQKVKAASALLGQQAMDKMDHFSKEYPNWKLAQDDSDEFPFWMDDGHGLTQTVVVPPISRRELVIWLKHHPHSDTLWQKDDWSQRCRDDFPRTACALFAMSSEGEWPVDRWREAIHAWVDAKHLKRSWRYVARVIVKAPDEVLGKIQQPLSGWLQVQAKSFLGQEKLFFELIARLLKVADQSQILRDDDPVLHAINHPVGHMTDALLNWWYRQQPKDGEGLSSELKPLLTQLCDIEIEKYRHGRVILAAHTIALFRVDEVWCSTYILPLFDWHTSTLEAPGVWEGFLWSPRLYPPLLRAIKPFMLETASHYTQLGKHAEQFATFLTFAALDSGEIFTSEEFANATKMFPIEGLHCAAQTLVRALEGAGEQRREYWDNRVLPYFRSIWPKTQEVVTPELSESFARLCIASKEAFPEAFDELQHWLKPVKSPDYLISQLSESSLCHDHPSESLRFLAAVIGDDVQWLSRELRVCLDQIKSANPKLIGRKEYVRLEELIQRRGLV